MVFNLNKLDPIIIAISFSDLIKDCTLEIVQGKNVLTQNVNKLELEKAISYLVSFKTSDLDWFILVASFMKHLTTRKRLQCKTTDEYNNLYAYFIKVFDMITATQMEDPSKIEFKYIDYPDDEPGSVKILRIDEKGLLNNFIQPIDKFSNIINNNIRETNDIKKIILDLHITNCIRNENWEDIVLKKSNLNNEQLNQLSNFKQDLYIGIVCFLNLCLKESLISIIINFLDYITLKDTYSNEFIDKNISELILKN
jgi:hypothetical protein